MGPTGLSTVELAGPPPEGCALRHAPVLLPMLLTGVSDETEAWPSTLTAFALHSI